MLDDSPLVVDTVKKSQLAGTRKSRKEGGRRSFENQQITFH